MMEIKFSSIFNVWKRGCRQQKRYALLGIMALSVMMTSYWWVMLKSYVPLQAVDLRPNINSLEATIEAEDSLGCQMPYLDPFSSKAMEYHKDVPAVSCKKNDWVECFKHKCYIKEEIHQTIKDIVCLYKDILFFTDQKYVIGKPTKVTGRDYYKLDRSDLVKVSCTGNEIKGYGLVASRWYGHKAGLRPLRKPKLDDELNNVMILCFDSASHNGFLRKMPLSYKYLTEDLKAVVLDSYNIVGDGTPNAIYPLMTGKGVGELSYEMIGTTLFVDLQNLLFTVLQKKGYRTAYFEDSPRTGTFTYRYNGFSTQPADHYLRPLFLEDTTEVTWWFGVENTFCIGSTPHYEFMLNLTKQVYQLDGKKFSFTFIADICHDEFNYITWSDKSVVEFLTWMKDQGRMEDTLMIVMGDHGVRFGTYRDTYQGKIEERLPFMSIILPEKVKKLRPDALEALVDNKKVLTTPFDINTTILDALGMVEEDNNYTVPGSDLPRGMSLLKPIPKTRTCWKAGVVPYYCACTKWYNVSQTNPMYKKVAVALAEYINSLTGGMRILCANRKLASIHWVQQLSVGQEVWSDIHLTVPGSTNYQAKITVSPGNGMFEGSVKYKADIDQFSVSQQTISRINAYHDESYCINGTHPHLTQFCYCYGKLDVKNGRFN